jgi:hypothetical protein
VTGRVDKKDGWRNIYVQELRTLPAMRTRSGVQRGRNAKI